MYNNVSAQNSSQNPNSSEHVPGAKAGFDRSVEPSQAKPNGKPGGTPNEAVPSTAKEEPLRFVAPSHGGVDILKLLTDLEDLVENTKHGPLGMLFGFPEDQFHMTIMKIRANLPEEMKRASKLVREQERIVEETREGAERIKEEARRQALTDYERRKAEAESLHTQANSDATHLRAQVRDELERSRAEAEIEAQARIEEARREGERIVAEARDRAVQLVQDNDIVQQAQVMAQDLLVRAEQESSGVRAGADDYARTVLVNLEAVLGKAVTQIQRGRELLDSPR